LNAVSCVGTKKGHSKVHDGWREKEIGGEFNCRGGRNGTGD